MKLITALLLSLSLLFISHTASATTEVVYHAPHCDVSTATYTLYMPVTMSPGYIPDKPGQVHGGCVEQPVFQAPPTIGIPCTSDMIVCNQ